MRQVCCSSHHHLADLNPIPYPRSPRTLLTSENTTPPKNSFQEVRCDRVFEAMRQCCIKFKASGSLVCDGYDLEPRKFAPSIMENRRRIQPLGKRSWMYRYPRTFQITATLTFLGIFLSKPIYDSFFRQQELVDYTEPPTTLSRRRTSN
ncbi:unnamed protein product [Chilo suppressalis]|uniref:Deltamethrin resistance protein prag01 domain-containing protein n=1 Tax=Chilo suppressalis TaxID=168631 RepID=A0ABN8B5Z2_CHISP|nr:unnamed protein product [Chilo suppressalis]